MAPSKASEGREGAIQVSTGGVTAGESGSLGGGDVRPVQAQQVLSQDLAFRDIVSCGYP
jgi:hypothetical protein